MAKNEIKVDLKPIRDQIKKVQSELKGIKPQVALKARKKVDLDIKKLDAIAKKLSLICKGIMTHSFPGGE
jgi:anaerobic ribonucleoside-triphosphate reductase